MPKLIKWELHRDRDGDYVLFGRGIGGGKQIAIWLPPSANDYLIDKIKTSIEKAWGISDD